MVTEPRKDAFVEAAEDEYIITLGDLFRTIWKWLWVVLLLMIVPAVIAVGFSMSQTPQYQASVVIMIGQERGITENPEDVGGLQKLTPTMAETVGTRPVTEAVIQKLNLQTRPNRFLENLSVEEVPKTQLIRVAYVDPDPEKAQLVANTVGEVFSERISEVSPSASDITAIVWERAELPDAPVSPDPVLNGILGLALGGMLGVGVAYILQYLDNSWRSPEEAEQVSGVPTLGVIPEFKALTGKKKGGF